MTPNQIRGALLEYLVRRLFLKCGFHSVIADNLYSYLSGGLFMVHGKGAAHDADVFMQPPIQLPFAFPTRILFECKARSTRVGLPHIRNALGLRNDLNDFEIVTKKTLKLRRNNRRAQLAVEQRDRYWIQVGVAAINGFTKPAIEFAINNKIPLLSLDWYLLNSTIDSINKISDTSLQSYPPDELEIVYKALKDRNNDIDTAVHAEVYQILLRGGILGDILTFGNYITRIRPIGILQSGAFIFLHTESSDDKLWAVFGGGRLDLKARLFYDTDNPSQWSLLVNRSRQHGDEVTFSFTLPDEIMEDWRKKEHDQAIALNIKETMFSRIILFHGVQDRGMPFSIVTLDRTWIDQVRASSSSE